jgi:hypothetical protein
MPYSFQSSTVNQSDYTRWTVQIVKFLIEKPFPLPTLIIVTKKEIQLLLSKAIPCMNWKWTYPVLSISPFFSFPGGLCEPIDIICRLGIPFEAMTGRTALTDGLLAEVLSCIWGKLPTVSQLKCSGFSSDVVRWFFAKSHYHLIINLLIDRRDWFDTRGKRPLTRNPAGVGSNTTLP